MRELEYWGTLGPACADVDVLSAMLETGITGMRLNLSHTTLEQAAPLIALWKAAQEKTGIRAGLMIDLQGRELRTTNRSPVSIRQGEPVNLSSFMDPAWTEGADIVHIDDKRIELVRKGPGFVPAADGIIGTRKSVAIPGKTIDMPLLTAEDRTNLEQAAACGVTAVMMPFVQSAAMLEELRPHVGNLKLYAKIEDAQGLAHLEEIMDAADVTVFARGDLGMNLPLEKLPLYQERAQKLAVEKGKPLLVVTQMLDSMHRSPVPTRAEVVDIYTACRQGAAALMLTGETAAGNYPVQAAAWLVRVARTALDDAVEVL